MIWFNYVETVLLPLIIVAEIVALVVSNQQRNRIRNKHQMYLITTLCVSELNGAFAAIVTHIIYGRLPEIGNAIMWFYIHTFSRLTHYSTMALLTIDRFLVFHLNIKYNAVWSPTKLLKTFAFMSLLFSFLSALYTWSFQSWLIGYILPTSCSCHIWFGMFCILYWLLVRTSIFSVNTRNTWKWIKGEKIKQSIKNTSNCLYQPWLL